MPALLSSLLTDSGVCSCGLLTVCVLSFLLAVGWLLVPAKTLSGSRLQRTPVRLASGSIFAAGVFATWGLGRLNYLSLLPILQLLLAVYWHIRKPRTLETGQTSDPLKTRISRGDLVMDLGAFSAVTVAWFLIGWWIHHGFFSDGRVVSANMDLSYFAMLAKELPEAKVSSLWTAVLGPLTREAGEAKDVWYHWGAVWLVSGISRISGMAPLAVLLNVVTPVLNTTLTLAAGGIVSSFTGWKMRHCLLVGGLSIIALAFPSMAWIAWLARVVPGAVSPHLHTSLAYQFSYKLEAAIVLAAILCWMQRRVWLAAFFLFCGAVFAPHTVAVGGITAGFLGLLGLCRRDGRQIRLAAGIIATLIAGWAAIAVLFGVSMPKTDAAQFIDPSPAHLLHDFLLACLDVPAGVLLALLIVPGLLHLVRAKDSKASEETRMLGWLSISALIGSFFAYHLLLPQGDRSHFTMYAFTVLVMPVGFWGLAGLISRHQGLPRRLAIYAMATTVLAGGYELLVSRAQDATTPFARADLAGIKAVLGNEAFGYYAERDRNWWLPIHATLAGELDTRCVRLNKIAAKDSQTLASQFYGSQQPYVLTPSLPGETENAWSLRFARRMGLKYILEIKGQDLPAEWQPHLKCVASANDLRLFALGPETVVSSSEPQMASGPPSQ